MNNFHKIHKRLYSFCAYNLLLYANFLLLFGLASNIHINSILSTAIRLLPAYLFIGISGYFLNDLFDKKADELSNKFNITKIINKYVLLFLILIFGFIGYYLLFTISKKASIVLIFQFLLLLGYSVPYIRLKEKGILGLITDAIYAHVIPGIILLYILQEYTAISISLWTGFIAFTVLLGLRDIALHQLKDIENDKQSDTLTFAVKNQKTIKNLIRKFNFYAAFTLCVLLFFVQKQASSILFTLLFCTLTISYVVLVIKYKILPKDALIDNYIVISSIVLFSLLMKTNNLICMLLLLHPYFIQKSKSFSKWLMITLIPLTVNYSLYFIFLPLGRNLKEKPFYKKN